MGKATVTRTMDVIKALQEDYQEKTSFYMTKADQIDSQSDIMDVIAQTVRVSVKDAQVNSKRSMLS